MPVLSIHCLLCTTFFMALLLQQHFRFSCSFAPAADRTVLTQQIAVQQRALHDKPRLHSAADIDDLDDNDNAQDTTTATTYYSPNVPLGGRRTDQRKDDDEADAIDASNSSSSSINEYSFFDEAIIYARAGSGGQGANTYRKIGGPYKNQNGPPDGGNGGNGGNILLRVDPSLNTLAGLTQAWRPNSFGGSGAAAVVTTTTSTATAATTHPSKSASTITTTTRPKSFRAENGSDGDRQFKNGRFGKDVVIRVPPGTVVEEQVLTDEKEKWIPVGSLQEVNDELLVAKGGQGGEGTAVQGKNRGVKRPRLPPTGGERKLLKLTLKIVADVALVGVPNAGKSTFLAAVTRAKPKIANYPFTTVIPNLGVWIPSSAINSSSNTDDKLSSSDTKVFSKGAGSDGLVLCDVPGLIAGAAQGVGLGHAFLRHVERCHVILHLIDATSNDPIADYAMLNQEIIKYGTGQLANMPQVVVINKVDAFDKGACEDWEAGLQIKWSRDKLETEIKKVIPHSRLMWMSAKERDGVDDLMTRLAAFVKKVKETKQ